MARYLVPARRLYASMPGKILMSAIKTAALLASTGVALAQDPENGARVFKRCAVCHSTTGAPLIGPHLDGVMGRKAGAVPGYGYSGALSNSAVVWDETTLDAFLTRPQAVVPGVRMAFAGLPRAKDRQDLIAYLATLHKPEEE